MLSLMTKTMNNAATLLVYIVIISALFASKATSAAGGNTRLSISCVDTQESASTASANVPPGSDKKFVIEPKKTAPTEPFALMESSFVGSDCVTGETSVLKFDTDIIARSISAPIAGPIGRHSCSPPIGPAARRARATKNTDCITHPDTNSSMSNNALSVCTPKMNNDKSREKLTIKNNHHNHDFTEKYQENTTLMAERELNEAVVVAKAKRLVPATKVRETIETVIIHRATTDQLHDAIHPGICCHCYDEGTYNYFECNLV